MANKTYTDQLTVTPSAYIDVTLTATPNTEGNYSNVAYSVVFRLGGNNNYYKFNSGNKFIFKLNGTTLVNSSNVCAIQLASAGTSKTLASGNIIVYHDEDGNCTFPVYAYFDQTQRDGYTAEIDDTFTCDTIARKSTLTVDNGTLGEAQVLTIDKKAESYTHSVSYKCGDVVGAICEKTESSEVTFTPPLDLARQNVTGDSVNIVYTLETFNGESSMGTTQKTITCEIPASVAPSVTFTVDDAEGYKNEFGTYIQGKSRYEVNISAVGAYGATVIAYSTFADGKTYTNPSFVSDIITVPDGVYVQTITVTVTDTRGRSASAVKEVQISAYDLPKISTLKVERCDADGNLTIDGAYLKVDFSADVTPLSGNNTALYSVSYKKDSATAYTEVPLSNLDGMYTVVPTYIFAADVNSSYDVIVTAADAFGSVTRSAVGKSKGMTFSMHHSGSGWAFGKKATRKDALEVAWDIYDKYGMQMRNGVAAYESAGIDANTTTEQHILTQTNTPSNTFHHVLTYFYIGKDGNNNRVQLAIPYKTSTSIYHRYYVNGVWSDWLNEGLSAYPVGAYYISHNDTSPAELFGGTWHRIESRFLWGAPASSTLGLTAGEMTHTLTIDEMPTHNHLIYTTGGSASRNVINRTWSTSALTNGSIGSSIEFAGGSAAHNNMPPYVNVAIWRRTA